jgi:intracellular septation protein A
MLLSKRHRKARCMDTGSDATQTARTGAANGGRLRVVTMIVIFDVAAPLAAYSGLRSAGLSAVTSLLLSGVFPAVPVSIDAIRHRRLEVVGALVLAGILVGTVLGLISGNARLLLVEGSVPTAVFAVGLLGSLLAPQPLMFRFAREFVGPDTAKGREMSMLWQHYEGFRHVFRIMTAVWGVAFLIEAALRVVVVLNASTGTALLISKVSPFVFVGILLAWTVAYGARDRKRAVRMIAAGDLTLPGQPQADPETIVQSGLGRSAPE